MGVVMYCILFTGVAMATIAMEFTKFDIIRKIIILDFNVAENNFF